MGDSLLPAWVLPSPSTGATELKARERLWKCHEEACPPPGLGLVRQKGWGCGNLSDSAGVSALTFDAIY